MADTGFKSPTSEGDDYIDWVEPTSAYSSDNYLAYSVSEGDLHDYYDFTFGVPEGATIDGIEVSIEGSGGGMGFPADIEVELSWDGGSSYTSENKQNTFPGLPDESTEIYGNSSDTWGRTWSDSEFSNANFRARVENIAANPCIDHLQVKVYYTEGAAGTNMQVNVNDAWKTVSAIKVNVDDAWKDVSAAKVNKDDAWKTIF